MRCEEMPCHAEEKRNNTLGRHNAPQKKSGGRYNERGQVPSFLHQDRCQIPDNRSVVIVLMRAPYSLSRSRGYRLSGSG